MKHILTILLAIAATASLHAVSPMHSGIANGTEWYNDDLVYKAETRNNGTIAFSACSEGEELAFYLTPIADKNGEYKLTGDEANYVNPFSECRKAKHLRKEQENLLCLYDGEGRLCEVLSFDAKGDGTTTGINKWRRQLKGEYRSRYGEPLKIAENGRMQFSAIDLTYRDITFNGIVTGVIEIKGGTRLEGIWLIELTRDGLVMNKGKIDEYEKFEASGETEEFTWARKDKPRFGYASEVLLNDGLLRRLATPLLRLMRNEIWFHHGYVPASEDLREYLENKDWYAPRETNDGIYDQLSLIEKLNIEMIKTKETMREQMVASNMENFDIDNYKAEMTEIGEQNLNWRKSLEDIKLISYSLIDIDNDGITEVWVKGDEGQDYQGIYAITAEGGVVLIGNSDARSELQFYPGAVGQRGYNNGEITEFVQTVRGSLPADYCCKRVLINNFSNEQEIMEEDYNVNGKSVGEKEYQSFLERLGEPYEPKVEWHSCR